MAAPEEPVVLAPLSAALTSRGVASLQKTPVTIRTGQLDEEFKIGSASVRTQRPSTGFRGLQARDDESFMNAR